MTNWKEWIRAALIRAIRTFAEAMLAYIGTGAIVLGDVNWLAALSAGAFGFVMYNTFVSILRAAGDSRHPLIYLIISSVILSFSGQIKQLSAQKRRFPSQPSSIPAWASRSRETMRT